MIRLNDELMHFGTKGMRWGFRRQPVRTGKPTNQIKKRARESKYYNEQSKIKGTWQYYDKAANMHKKVAIANAVASATFAIAAQYAANHDHPAEKWLSEFAKATSIGTMFEISAYGANQGASYGTRHQVR